MGIRVGDRTMGGCLTYESNVRFALRFMIDKNVVSCEAMACRWDDGCVQRLMTHDEGAELQGHLVFASNI
eukprot:1158779-Pelagomonas_calceolata.AAC.2